MSDWPGWAGVIVAVLSFAASAYAIYDARKAREAVDRAEKLSIIDTLLNQHEIRRSHWDIWGYAEVDLKGMRTAISEWRDICSQQMNLLPRDSAK